MTTKRDIVVQGRRQLRLGRRPDEVLVELGEDWPRSELPGIRTIQRWKAQLTGCDEPWSFVDAEPDEAGPVLAALRAVALASEGRVTTIGQTHADLVVRIARAAPGISPLDAYQAAGDYLDLAYGAAEHRRMLPNLDLWLAFEGWTPEGNAAFAAFQSQSLTGAKRGRGR